MFCMAWASCAMPFESWLRLTTVMSWPCSRFGLTLADSSTARWSDRPMLCSTTGWSYREHIRHIQLVLVSSCYHRQDACTLRWWRLWRATIQVTLDMLCVPCCCTALCCSQLVITLVYVGIVVVACLQTAYLHVDQLYSPFSAYGLKPGFHYPSGWPELTGDRFPLPINTARVDG